MPEKKRQAFIVGRLARGQYTMIFFLNIFNATNPTIHSIKVIALLVHFACTRFSDQWLLKSHDHYRV